MTVAGVLLFMAAGLLIWAIATRRRQYKYALKQDYRYDLGATAEETIQVRLNAGRCTFDGDEGSTLIAQCSVKGSWVSLLFQPYIETECGGKTRRHYFEHGGQGIRYIDLSDHLDGKSGEVLFRAHRCRMDDAITFYRFSRPFDANATVLVLAPHADDAEIAAFGLYSSHNAYIVTTTAGEEGKCDYCDLFESKQEGIKAKGLLRLHDALHIPELGGVGVERCAALGYFGVTLKQMHDAPQEKAVSKSSGVETIDLFRRTAHTGFIQNDAPEATWESLLRDLQSALEQLRPDVVVTPHPKFDSHSDHRYTTVALVEAMRRTAFHGRILTYTNHHVVAEPYPFGPMFSTSMLPPWFDAPLRTDALFSHPLSRPQQLEKFYALEAMHDLRDATMALSLSKTWKQLRRLLRRDLGGRDKSYFRRAVRNNELFFVLDAGTLEGMCS